MQKPWLQPQHTSNFQAQVTIGPLCHILAFFGRLSDISRLRRVNLMFLDAIHNHAEVMWRNIARGIENGTDRQAVWELLESCGFDVGADFGLRGLLVLGGLSSTTLRGIANTSTGSTCLHLAAIHGNLSTCRVLLSYISPLQRRLHAGALTSGAKEAGQNVTPLQIAVDRGHPDLVDLFLSSCEQQKCNFGDNEAVQELFTNVLAQGMFEVALKLLSGAYDASSTVGVKGEPVSRSLNLPILCNNSSTTYSIFAELSVVGQSSVLKDAKTAVAYLQLFRFFLDQDTRGNLGLLGKPTVLRLNKSGGARRPALHHALAAGNIIAVRVICGDVGPAKGMEQPGNESVVMAVEAELQRVEAAPSRRLSLAKDCDAIMVALLESPDSAVGRKMARFLVEKCSASLPADPLARCLKFCIRHCPNMGKEYFQLTEQHKKTVERTCDAMRFLLSELRADPNELVGEAVMDWCMCGALGEKRPSALVLAISLNSLALVRPFFDSTAPSMVVVVGEETVDYAVRLALLRLVPSPLDNRSPTQVGDISSQILRARFECLEFILSQQQPCCTVVVGSCAVASAVTSVATARERLDSIALRQASSSRLPRSTPMPFQYSAAATATAEERTMNFYTDVAAKLVGRVLKAVLAHSSVTLPGDNRRRLLTEKLAIGDKGTTSPSRDLLWRATRTGRFEEIFLPILQLYQEEEEQQQQQQEQEQSHPALVALKERDDLYEAAVCGNNLQVLRCLFHTKKVRLLPGGSAAGSLFVVLAGAGDCSEGWCAHEIISFESEERVRARVETSCKIFEFLVEEMHVNPTVHLHALSSSLSRLCGQCCPPRQLVELYLKHGADPKLADPNPLLQLLLQQRVQQSRSHSFPMAHLVPLVITLIRAGVDCHVRVAPPPPPPPPAAAAAAASSRSSSRRKSARDHRSDAGSTLLHLGCQMRFSDDVTFPLISILVAGMLGIEPEVGPQARPEVWRHSKNVQQACGSSPNAVDVAISRIMEARRAADGLTALGIVASSSPGIVQSRDREKLFKFLVEEYGATVTYDIARLLKSESRNFQQYASEQQEIQRARKCFEREVLHAQRAERKEEKLSPRANKVRQRGRGLHDSAAAASAEAENDQQFSIPLPKSMHSKEIPPPPPLPRNQHEESEEDDG